MKTVSVSFECVSIEELASSNPECPICLKEPQESGKKTWYAHRNTSLNADNFVHHIHVSCLRTLKKCPSCRMEFNRDCLLPSRSLVIFFGALLTTGMTIAVIKIISFVKASLLGGQLILGITTGIGFGFLMKTIGVVIQPYSSITKGLAVPIILVVGSLVSGYILFQGGVTISTLFIRSVIVMIAPIILGMQIGGRIMNQIEWELTPR